VQFEKSRLSFELIEGFNITLTRCTRRQLPILCVFWEHLSQSQAPKREVGWEEFLRGGNRNTTLRDSFAWLAMPGETTHPAGYGHKFESLVRWLRFLLRRLPSSSRAGKPIKPSKFPFVSNACYPCDGG
jgi:hypothetical protein